MQANDKQIGGNHYQAKSIQPWDVVAAWGLGFFEGNALKYLARWRTKGGVTDLNKAIHYLQKLVEIEEASVNPAEAPDVVHAGQERCLWPQCSCGGAWGHIGQCPYGHTHPNADKAGADTRGSADGVYPGMGQMREPME